jgi:hypothetical protein
VKSDLRFCGVHRIFSATSRPSFVSLAGVPQKLDVHLIMDNEGPIRRRSGTGPPSGRAFTCILRRPLGRGSAWSSGAAQPQDTR